MIASVAAAALAIPQREMSRRAPHADNQIPAPGRARVFGKVADYLNAIMPRGFKTERRCRAGQWQIIVNCLGHVRDADFSVAAA